MSSVSNGLYFLTLPLVSVMRVIYTSKGMSKKFGMRVIYQKIRYGLKPQTWQNPFLCNAQLDLRFSPHFTQNFISWYIIVIQLIMFSLTPVFCTWNHKAFLSMESNAFTKSITHKYNLPLVAMEYLTRLDYKNLIYCFCSFSKYHPKQGQFFMMK
jgi:hypothetical protein